MAKAKNPRGKETSSRVASAAGRLMNLRRQGLRFFAVEFKPELNGYSIDMREVTDDVDACSGSANVQKLPKPKGQAKKRKSGRRR